MTWGLVVAGVAGVAGAAISSNGAKKAAGTQAQAAADATAAQERMFERQVELQQPWMDAGKQGLNVLSQYLGLTTPEQARQKAAADAQVFDSQRYYDAYLKPAAGQQADRYYNSPERALEHYNDWGRGEGREAFYTTTASGPVIADNQFGSLLKEFGASDFEADPGYAFRKEEQERALQRAASASGGLGSGRYLKDAMKYSGGLAAQEYGSAFDRFNVGKTNTFNRLAAMAGIGQTAANQTGAAAGNFGSQIGSNIIGAGNALAAGRVGSANAFNNAIGQGTSMYQNQLMMNRIFPQSGSSGGGYRYQVPTYEGAEY